MRSPRHADRAKQIKNKPKDNVDPTDALIQALADNDLKVQVGGSGATEMPVENCRRWVWTYRQWWIWRF